MIGNLEKGGMEELDTTNTVANRTTNRYNDAASAVRLIVMVEMGGLLGTLVMNIVDRCHEIASETKPKSEGKSMGERMMKIGAHDLVDFLFKLVVNVVDGCYEVATQQRHDKSIRLQMIERGMHEMGDLVDPFVKKVVQGCYEVATQTNPKSEDKPRKVVDDLGGSQLARQTSQQKSLRERMFDIGEVELERMMSALVKNAVCRCSNVASAATPKGSLTGLGDGVGVTAMDLQRQTMASTSAVITDQILGKENVYLQGIKSLDTTRMIGDLLDDLFNKADEIATQAIPTCGDDGNSFQSEHKQVKELMYRESVISIARMIGGIMIELVNGVGLQRHSMVPVSAVSAQSDSFTQFTYQAETEMQSNIRKQMYRMGFKTFTTKMKELFDELLDSLADGADSVSQLTDQTETETQSNIRKQMYRAGVRIISTKMKEVCVNLVDGMTEKAVHLTEQTDETKQNVRKEMNALGVRTITTHIIGAL